MNNKYNSPYSASVTGCGYMPDEMNNILPLLIIIRKSKCSRISKRKVHFTKRNV